MDFYRNTAASAASDCTVIAYQATPVCAAPRRMSGALALEGEWVKVDAIPADQARVCGFGGYAFFGSI